MARPGIPKEQKKREGDLLRGFINERKKVEPDLTRESLGAECGVTQGNVSQWISGVTPIPDKTLMFLGARLGFNPFEVRPSLAAYSYTPASADDRRAEIERVTQILASCDDHEFAQVIGIFGALFPGVDANRR